METMEAVGLVIGCSASVLALVNTNHKPESQSNIPVLWL